MKVKFKDRGQMFYEVVDSSKTHLKLNLIGWIPREELCPYRASDNLVDVLDVAVHLAYNKDGEN